MERNKMKDSKTTIRKETTRTDREELNTNLITVIIKNNETGEVVAEETVGSILFAGVTEVQENGHGISAGVAGEFNINSLLQSVEAILDTAVQALKESYDLDADTFIKMMGKMTSGTIERNFSEADRMLAMIKGLAELAKKDEK